MKFTGDYINFTSQNGEIVYASYKEGQKYDHEFESVSLAESTFTMNWATAGIKEAEELRAITFNIRFKLKDGKGRDRKLTEKERGGRPKYRDIKLRDLKQDILEQLFVGGEATIHLSSADIGNSRIEIGADSVTKPKSSMKFTVDYSNFSKGKRPNCKSFIFCRRILRS